MYLSSPKPNETQEEFGWKLIHGDVFRAPRRPMLFAVLVGSGVQMALTSVITLFFACFGILSPIHRGAFATCAIAVFVCLGASAGEWPCIVDKFLFHYRSIKIPDNARGGRIFGLPNQHQLLI